MTTGLGLPPVSGFSSGFTSVGVSSFAVANITLTVDIVRFFPCPGGCQRHPSGCLFALQKGIAGLGFENDILVLTNRYRGTFYVTLLLGVTVIRAPQ
eukprot:sb/3479053/